MLAVLALATHHSCERFVTVFVVVVWRWYDNGRAIIITTTQRRLASCIGGGVDAFDELSATRLSVFLLLEPHDFASASGKNVT